MIGLYLPSREEISRRQKRIAQRMASAVPWSDDARWQPEMAIQGQTYCTRHYFSGRESTSARGLWRYSETRFPKGHLLRTHYGSLLGDIVFDADVSVPMLHVRVGADWSANPYMSLTPMEILSLRSGTRFARGDVVVAGLGLGHQAIEVSHKKTVRSVTVVERCADLVDFVWPEVAKHLGQKPVKVIVGDAYEVLPQITADVALVDIFPDYGSNRFEVVTSKGWRPVPCPGIKRVWCWGAADVKDS